ncbi:MAG TPA: hypothetical protein VMV48_12820 [Gallionellaceae bacterium]|nr:hypothetical protein [Gallionellaceae bacterium]
MMASTNANTEGYIARSTSNLLLNEGIVALAALQMFLASTIPSLKVFQIPVELMLLTALLYACTTIKFDRWQVLLLFIFSFVTTASLLTTDFATFGVNAKQNGLAVLSLLYFSKVTFKSRLIYPIFITSLCLMIINRFEPEMVLPFIALTYNEDFNLSRFGGVFLSAHFNAFFLAIALIYYGQLRRLYGLGVWIVYFADSKFIFASYVANLLATSPVARFLIKFRRALIGAAVVFLLGSLYLLVKNVDSLIEFVLLANEDGSQNSAVVIILELVDPAYYKLLLNPFPSVLENGIPEGIRMTYGDHIGSCEIGLFNLATQSGIFLAVAYLLTLLKHARFYAVFILASLLHNNFIHSPLAVYMLVTYSREIYLQRSAKSRLVS